MTEKSLVVAINEEMGRELSNPKVCQALLATTFKGLEEHKMKQAIMEGMIRGFKFKDFLEKNVYAIPFAGGYSLVTSIDNSRKIGMRSGIVGKDAPIYEEKDGKIETCAVTVHRRVNGYVGQFTSKVYFKEYYKAGKNGYPSLWDTKPRTMIAKVAEMHALRMACPEELSQSYIEEEMTEVINIENQRVTDAKVEAGKIKMGNLIKNDDKEKEVEENNQGTPADSEPVIEA